ncbi:MAG: serine/threonine protein kinase [Chloroflexi bacterium]|nr:serine/threonine protein kinase [Chloroflexota bacterium]
MMTAMQSTCSECGKELPPDAPRGLCPACLFQIDEPTVVGPFAGSETATTGPAFGTRRFGDYELLDEIARGGMGIVYKARQLSLDRIVALKMILFGSMASAEQIRRFRIEASAAGSLQHPNIVTVHEVGLHEGQHFLVMDYVDGPNLSRLVHDQPLPAKKAAAYLKAIAEAVQFAHDRGIMHRDLKPSNVLIGSDDRPRVTDFGLAKRFDAESSLTLSGHLLGSPNYMPPEQAGGGRNKVGRASDVYSLGAILYHLLTARPPFRAETLSETLQQVQQTEPISPRLLNASVPRDLETICLKCLEKEPAKRFQTAALLAEELGRFLNDEPIQARPVSAPEKVWRWCRRKPALASAISLAVLLLLVVAIGSPLVALRIDRARQDTARNLYAADIKGASVALEEHDLPGARKLLEQIAVSPDQRNLRGWEWRYLMAQCRSDELVKLGQHDVWLEGVAFSPDDKVLASISGDGVVKLWDWMLRTNILSWQAHRPVLKHRPSLRSHAVIFLPRTSMLATSGADGFVHLWNPGSTTPVASLEDPGSRLGALAVSPNGRLLACGNLGGKVSLWDISADPPTKLSEWTDSNLTYVYTLLFLPDGRLMVSGRKMICLDVSDPRRPKNPRPLKGHLAMALSPDGRSLVSQADDSDSFMLWDVPSLEGKLMKQSQGVKAFALSFSPDQRSLVSCPGSANIVFLDLDPAVPQRPVTLAGHEDLILSLAFTSDGKTLASASYDKTVRLWDAFSIWRGDLRSQPMVRHESLIRGLWFSPDSRYLASTSWVNDPEAKATNVIRSTIKLWDVATRTEVAGASAPGGSHAGRIEFSPDGKTLVLDTGGTLQHYAVPSLQPTTHWPGSRPAYSQDGSVMVHAVQKRIVRRHPLTGQEVPIGEQNDGVMALALSPDGTTAVTSGNDSGGTMTFWDVLGKQPPVPVGEHQGRIPGLAFSPDGQTLASASQDRTLGLWDVKHRRKIDLLSGHKGWVDSVAFSPDGRTLATGGFDNTVRLWNLQSRREVAVLLGHSATVTTLAFSPDGQWLASGDGSGAIRFWHAPTLKEIAAAQKTKEK